MFKRYNYLGAQSYYCPGGNSDNCYMSFNSLHVDNPTIEKHIDPAAVLSVLMKNYIFAERTLINGISRSPWMAKPDGFGGWEYADLPKHGKVIMESNDIAKKLKKLLYNEFLSFASNKKTIGILLSGGMDSRVIAAIIKKAQKTGDYSGDVVAFTWGLPNSRDVIYAKKICHRYSWSFIHILLTQELLFQNINLAVEQGAEYSPVHLHGIRHVASAKGLDGVVAGSFGNNIGRGEYLGHRVTELAPITQNHHNKFSFLKRLVVAESIINLKIDLHNSRKCFVRNNELEYREVDSQKHYLYRHLNPCMNLISEKIPFYQMFGHPDVFGFMWSLNYKCRNDWVYYYMLKKLPGNLLDIPWSRTGKLYLDKGKQASDDCLSLHNAYGRWLRNDCRNFIIECILSGDLQSLGIFNEKALKIWIKDWAKSKLPKADRFDEKIAWLASLSLFIKKYKVHGVEGYSMTVADDFSLLVGRLYHWLYVRARQVIKND